MRERLTITDTQGNPLPRASAAAVRRALSRPVNITVESQRDYAMCHCAVGGASVSVIRAGIKGSCRTTFKLSIVAADGEQATEDAADLDQAVCRFFQAIKSFSGHAQHAATT